MNSILTTQIDLGPLSLALYVILLVTAAAAGSIGVLPVFKGNKNLRRLFFDTLSSSLLIIVVLWKLYPLFGSFTHLVKNPLAILYLPGGIPGVMFGIFFSILFFLYKTYRNRELLKPFIIFMVIFTITAASFSLLPLVKPNLYKKAPVFTGKSTTGATISLKDYRNKTIILNFFATWCPPCRGELPVLISFVNDMDKENTILLGVNSFASEKSIQHVKDFIKTRGINYPVVLDSGNISALYNVKTLPTTIIISPKGKVLLKHQGVIDSFLLKSQLYGNSGPVIQ